MKGSPLTMGPEFSAAASRVAELGSGVAAPRARGDDEEVHVVIVLSIHVIMIL